MRLHYLDRILEALLDSHEEVSDINLTVGRPLQVETYGELRAVLLEPISRSLTPFQTEIVALNLLGSNRRLLRTLVQEGSCDLSYEIPGRARFRVNIFTQKQCFSVVMRQLPTQIPTIQELGLPSVFYDMTRELNGIILVTGATGTGKTTTLAAFLEELNATRPIHIVTLEDPVEYIHTHKKATFNQRELGTDFDTFASGLRAALRQAPKVILVGEMRDRESLEIALSAAETGHLVLSTLHTVNCGQTINRILGMFDPTEERHIRTRLADTLRWVVAQRLLPKLDGGRVAVFEVMRSTLRIQDVILHGESEGKTFYEILESGAPHGMMTFDQCILRLFEEGQISEQTALAFASRRSVVARGIDAIKASRGEKTTPIEGLTVEREEQWP